MRSSLSSGALRVACAVAALVVLGAAPLAGIHTQRLQVRASFEWPQSERGSAEVGVFRPPPRVLPGHVIVVITAIQTC